MKVFKKIVFMVLAVSMILVCVSCKSGKKTGDSEGGRRGYRKQARG